MNDDQIKDLLDQDDPPLADLLRAKIALSWDHPLYSAVVAKLNANPEYQEKVLAKEEAEAQEKANADALRRKRAQAHAARVVALENRQPIPGTLSLDDIAAAPDPTYYVDELWPENGRVVLTGPAKAGKSTFVVNLARSLTSGSKFLGRFDVSPLMHGVFVLDAELSPSQIKGYYKSLLGTGADLRFLALRGHMGAANLLDPDSLDAMAEVIRGSTTLIVDPLGPFITAAGVDENDNTGVRQVLMALDELCQKAGVEQLLVVHHFGHGNERGRGASVLKDWPDALWKMSMDNHDDPTSTRYFDAFGRGVDFAPKVLEWHAGELTVSHLTKAAAKKKATMTDLRREVLAFVKANAGCTKKAVNDGVTGNAGDIAQAIDDLEADGALTVTRGRSHTLTLAEPDTEAVLADDGGAG